MKRNILRIDEEKCTGCELCIPNCPEGAIQIIDGKARLVSDLLCDGLGACLGHCPEDAISIEEREAEEYDERKVMENIVKQGANTVKAHLIHLKEHGQEGYYNQAVEYLKEHSVPIPGAGQATLHRAHSGGCPGSRVMAFAKEDRADDELAGKRSSQLTHWPIQMHLLSPNAPHYQGADMLLAADCVAYSLGDFHKDYLRGKVLGIACPKLDEGQEIYLEKLKALIDVSKINTLTVMIMQVPCCRGLLNLALQAASQAERRIPVKSVVVDIQGEILNEEWVQMIPDGDRASVAG
ncbi:MAG: 4Fe-4S dicluster domain-containing protein [Proteobacteria bacterium]|nr:4Fe-4S dicluster domain-containing protein [Pseudomonadota bacterium]